VKSELLAARGQEDEARELMAGAMDLATEVELNTYGYRLLGRGEVDRAIDVFKVNVERHPQSWNVYDSLAEAYMTKGDTKHAIEFYEKALSMVEDEAQKGRIRGQLSQLRE
jgi:Tfp pilus assembly protein PilF